MVLFREGLRVLELSDVADGLVCFGLDGTLVPGASSCAWVAAALGREGELVAAEAAYLAGRVPEAVGGCYTGRVAEHLDEFGKRDFALSQGFPPERCAAVGDSRSDLPLFAAVGTSIGFNAAPAARAVATHVVDGSDLRAILPLLESQFSSV